MKVITLMENTSEPNSSLVAKHGLSLYIETARQNVLFDTGPDEAFLDNAQNLGVNLAEVNCLVISHAHGDHGGGLEGFLTINNSAQVYLSTRVRGQYFAQRGESEFEYIGLKQDVLDTYKDRIHFIDERTVIAPGITLLPPTEHSTFAPRAILWQKKEGILVRDSFEHELIMVIEEEGDLHGFTGCSHNGIINMIQSVEKVFPHNKLRTLWGGFHLMNTKTGALGEEIDTVKNIALMLQERQISKIYTGHCTGEEGYKILKEILGATLDSIRTGKTILVSDRSGC